MHKSDNKIINKYCHISILPVFSEISEKKYFNSFVELLRKKNKLLFEHQRSFMANHSKKSAMIEFTNNVYIHLAGKKQQHVGGVFDSLSHFILLDKMEYYGV